MRRFNGWGDDSIAHSIPASAIPKLDEWVGPGTHPLDAKLDKMIAAVPEFRPPDHPLV